MSFAVCIIRECLSQAHLRSEEGARLIVTVEFFYQKGKNEEVGGQEVVFIPTRVCCETSIYDVLAKTGRQFSVRHETSRQGLLFKRR